MSVEDITISEFRRGFGQIYRRLWRGNDLPPYDRMVIANMLERLGQNSAVWPSQSTIAEDLGISARSVWSALKRLQERGWVTVKRRGHGQTAVYSVDIKAVVKWANTPKNRTVRDQESHEMRPRIAPDAIIASRQMRREDPPLEDPQEEDPPRKIARAKRAPLTPDERSKLNLDFADLGDVEAEIDQALNNKAVDRCKSEYLYVRGWLTRQRRWANERSSNGNGRVYGPQRVAAQDSSVRAGTGRYFVV